MPKEYIDRELVINDIDNIVEILKKPPMQQVDKKLVETFKLWKLRFLEATAADVVEVKHGHWKQNPHCKRIYFCSECGRHIEDGSNTPTEFFPYCHCGAKMDGKDGVSDE